mgnify:CR=1 FL=1
MYRYCAGLLALAGGASSEFKSLSEPRFSLLWRELRSSGERDSMASKRLDIEGSLGSEAELVVMTVEVIAWGAGWVFKFRIWAPGKEVLVCSRMPTALGTIELEEKEETEVAP